MCEKQIARAKIAVVGSGSIGISFSLLFATSGAHVALQDPDASRREAARNELRQKLAQLQASHLLTESLEEILGRVQIHESLTDALQHVDLVQECAPESLTLKQALFSELAAHTDEDCILASSSSALTASQIADASSAASRILVAHPANPPHLIPVIELVPSSHTAESVITRAGSLYAQSGLSPVHVRKEIEGFLFNRLQGAVLREAYSLVRDGVASVEDIDTIMRDGLGKRWSFMGPFETVDLNTRGGIEAHAQKMGPAYLRMGAERGQHDPWTPDLVAEVVRQRRMALPLSEWEARVAWRDQQLINTRTRVPPPIPDHRVPQIQNVPGSSTSPSPTTTE